jgi:hypothetical protein
MAPVLQTNPNAKALMRKLMIFNLISIALYAGVCSTYNLSVETSAEPNRFMVIEFLQE